MSSAPPSAGGGSGGIPSINVQTNMLLGQLQTQVSQQGRLLQRAQHAAKFYATQVNTGSRQNARVVQSSVQTQLRSLRQLRWNIITLAFVFRAVTQTIKGAYEGWKEAAEARGLLQGVQALATAYGISLASIVDDLQKVENGTLKTSEAIRAAQGALLIDQGRWASRYAELWESAKVAAVTGGGDVQQIFEGLLTSLESGDAKYTDSRTKIFGLTEAVQRYATEVGALTNNLNKQTRQQVILQTVQERTEELLEAGAQEALDSIASINALGAAWDRVTGALAVSVDLSGLVAVLNTAAQSVAFIVSGMAAWVELLKIATNIKGAPDASMEELLDQIRDVGLRTFEAVAEGMGIIFEKSELVEQGIDDITESIKKLSDEWKTAESRVESLLKAELSFQRRLEDMDISRGRRLEDISRDAAKSLEKIQKDLQDRIEDIVDNSALRRLRLYEDYLARLASLEAKFALNVEKARADLAERLIRIEQRFQDRIRQIEFQFADTIFDAISRRDASAALLATRRRNRDLQEARRQRGQDRSNTQREHQQRLHELRQNLELQQAEAKKSYERQIRDLEDSLKNQRDKAKKSHDDRLEDLEARLKDEEEALELSLERQLEDLERSLRKQKQDIEAQFRLALATARIQHSAIESEALRHVQRMTAIYQQFYGQGGAGVPFSPFAPGGFTPFNPEGAPPSIGGFTPFDLQRTAQPGTTTTTAPTPQDTSPRSVEHVVSGSVQQQVETIISQSIGGFEGRIGAAISEALQGVLQ